MPNDPAHRPPRGTPRAARRFVLPVILIGLTLWLLVGCIYLPTGERVQLTGTRQDFRRMAVYDAAGAPQIAGRFTRQAIEALLGRPRYTLGDGRRVVYVLHVKSGFLIAPLCFTARDRQDRCVGLVLDYDGSGRLAGWHELETQWRGGLFDEPYGLNAAWELQETTEGRLVDQAQRTSTTRD